MWLRLGCGQGVLLGPGLSPGEAVACGVGWDVGWVVGLLEEIGLPVGRGDGPGGDAVDVGAPEVVGVGCAGTAGAAELGKLPLAGAGVDDRPVPSGATVSGLTGSCGGISTASVLWCLPLLPPTLTGAGAGPASTGPRPGIDR